MIRAENIVQSNCKNETGSGQTQRFNFHIENGEFVAFIANSSTHKSCLIKTIGLLTSIEKGDLFIDNAHVSQFQIEERNTFRTQNIGIMFAKTLLIDELTVYENVELPLIYLKIDRVSRKKRVGVVLAQLNLSHRKNNYPEQLPVDLLKQVELARILVIKPKLILVDEPSANISVTGAEDLMLKLAEVNQMGVTVVITANENQSNQYLQRKLFLQTEEIITN